MKYQEAISLIINELNYLTSEGYSIESNEEGISLSKLNDETVNMFGVRILKQPDHFRVTSMNAGINFHELEQLIIPILKQAAIVGNSMNAKTTYTIGISVEQELMEKLILNESKLPLEIRRTEDIKTVADFVMNVYSDIFIDFFNGYTKSEDLYELVRDKNYREIASILTTGGVFKYFIIADKFDRNTTKEKMSNWIDQIKTAIENNPNEIQYKRFMKAGKLLANQLEYAM